MTLHDNEILIKCSANYLGHSFVEIVPHAANK